MREPLIRAHRERNPLGAAIILQLLWLQVLFLLRGERMSMLR